MTSPRADVNARRVEDSGTRRGRVVAWWRRWKDIIFAVVVLPTSVVAFWAGIAVRQNSEAVKATSEARAKDARVVLVIARQQAAQQKATAASAKVQCQRSRQYGPAFADYFEHVGVFSAKAADEYRRTIPKVCPK